MKHFLTAPAFIALFACASPATVKYKVIRSPSDMTADVFDTYTLQTSDIVISAQTSEEPASASASASASATPPAPKPADQKGAANAAPARSPTKKAGAKEAAAKPGPSPTPPVTKTTGLTVTSTPTEDSGIKLGLIHADQVWLKATVNLAKIDNTDLLQEAGVDVSNQSVDLINEIGGLAKAIIPLVAFEDVPQRIDLTNPVKIDTWDLLKASPSRAAMTFPPSPTLQGVKIVVGAVPVDALPLASSFPVTSSSIYYSACRTADVTVWPAGSQTSTTVRVKIADPNFVQRAPFPVKGKVTMASQCGASVTSEMSTDTTNALTIGTALATQAKAISDAIAQQKKASATPAK